MAVDSAPFLTAAHADGLAAQTVTVTHSAGEGIGAKKGEALAKGTPGSWEGASVFTPYILVAARRYWLFYTGTSKVYGKGFNPDSKIGIAVSVRPMVPGSVWPRTQR